MAITQIGYFGGVGPVFADDSPGGGKMILLQGGNSAGNGVFGLYAKSSAYAGNLGLTAANFTLGSYSDNQYVQAIPTPYKVPSTGTSFQSYANVASDWVDSSAMLPGQTSNSPTQPTSTGGGGSTGGTGTTGGTSTGGGTTGGTTTGTGSTDTLFSAPTALDNIKTFFSNYWWLILIAALILLYKPVIAPALGLGKKKRSYR